MPGWLLAQGQRELHERALVAAAVEPDAVAALGAALAVAEHQLGAVDAVVEVLAEQVGRPDERHAVGRRRASRRAAPRSISGSSWATISACTGDGAHVAPLAALDHARPSTSIAPS